MPPLKIICVPGHCLESKQCFFKITALCKSNWSKSVKGIFIVHFTYGVSYYG